MNQEIYSKVLDLVKQKVFYCHEYICGFENFKEELPSKEKFYSSLTGYKNSDNDYEQFLRFGIHFQWKQWKIIKTLYLKLDVLLVADFFEKFKNFILKNFRLCSSHYLSPPVLNSDAMLNMIKVQLELTSDADMYLFFEKCIRGGLSYISKRFNKASNKHLKSYDPKQE